MTSFVKFLLQPVRARRESLVSQFDDINVPEDLEIELGGEGSPAPSRLPIQRSPPNVLSPKDVAFEASLLPSLHADDECEQEDDPVLTSLRDIDINSPIAPATLAKSGVTKHPLRRSSAGFTSAETRMTEDKAESENTYRQLFDEDGEAEQIIFSRVRHNRFEYVKSALGGGISAQVVDDRGNSLLHVCAQNNLRKMAVLVIRAGCSVNLRNKKGFTALDYCVKYSFFDMGDWLMTQGACHGELFAMNSDRPARRDTMR